MKERKRAPNKNGMNIVKIKARSVQINTTYFCMIKKKTIIIIIIMAKNCPQQQQI